MNNKVYIVNKFNNNMVNEIKKNGDVITKYLSKNQHVTLSEMVRNLSLSRGQIRIAVAFLLGADRIYEINVGMAKVYNLQ